MTDPDPLAEPAASPPPAARKPRRLTADYRWTMPKVLAFLEALSTCGSVAEAARSVGMSRQSAYRMRARLAGTRIPAAFEGARRQGIRARAAASRERLRSRWDGEGLGTYLARRASGEPPQGDAGRPQGDASAAQGDTFARQGDAIARKATHRRLDDVTGVTGGPGALSSRPRLREIDR